MKKLRSDVEQEIKKELGLPEWLLLMPFLEEILEQAKAWQSLTTIIPTEDKKLPYLIQANRLARKCQNFSD